MALANALSVAHDPGEIIPAHSGKAEPDDGTGHIACACSVKRVLDELPYDRCWPQVVEGRNPGSE